MHHRSNRYKQNKDAPTRRVVDSSVTSRMKHPRKMRLLTLLILMQASTAKQSSCEYGMSRTYASPVMSQHPGMGSEYEQMPVSDRRLCVAVLTGYPEIDNRLHLLRRLLRSLVEDFRIPQSQLHVFCQGDCQELLNDTFPATYHHLSNVVNRSSYRGHIISENYRLLFDKLFGSEGHYEYCAILEDDLVLSPDAVNYLRAGRTLMASDETVFTVSLYNDNAYPWCASDGSFFRRVDHFSGLGFLMSAAIYRSFVLPAWTTTLVWDNLCQVRSSY